MGGAQSRSGTSPLLLTTSNYFEFSVQAAAVKEGSSDQNVFFFFCFLPFFFLLST